MGYDLHITRGENWMQTDGTWIRAQQWLDYVAQDPELKLAGFNGEYFVLWQGPSPYPDPWWRPGHSPGCKETPSFGRRAPGVAVALTQTSCLLGWICVRMAIRSGYTNVGKERPASVPGDRTLETV
jgi:hypothetical protein